MAAPAAHDAGAELHDGPWWALTCTCGWRTRRVRDRNRAVGALGDHLRQAEAGARPPDVGRDLVGGGNPYGED